MSEGIWTIRPCPHRQASALSKELDLSEITASVLVRRGYGDPEVARAFLAGEQPLHDPSLLGDMAVAVERIRAAIAAGRRICVHGDYDVDGICATVLAVLVLRELGADVAWHLPSRFDEGYGVSGETLERLAGEGCGLALTVDCGITAVDEVRRASELGLEVIVTDHHRPGEELPDCPVVATKELCGTGVAFKLGQALLGEGSEVLRRGRAGRGGAGGQTPPQGIRRLGGGLARGGDRDRRVAARRALSPPRGAARRWRRAVEGVRPLDPVVRPARCAARVRAASRALRRASRGRRPLDPA